MTQINEVELIEQWRKDFERDFASKGTGHGFQISSFGGYESPVVKFMWQGYCMGRKFNLSQPKGDM